MALSPISPLEMVASFPLPDPDRYPELTGYKRDEIYRGCMGGGALHLAARMLRTMRLSEGDIVLDLGCGRGATSVFLVRHCGVHVVALDLWISATELSREFSQAGYRDRIIPLNLDCTQRLPFAEEYFDAIFCMNSLSFYGGSVEFLNHLLAHLKPGGQLCVGMETLNEEFGPNALADPPSVFNYQLPPPNEHVNVWESDFSKMHSPAWWQRLFVESGLLDVTDCFELDDAVLLYADLVRYQTEHNLDPEDVRWSLAQLAYGQKHRPYKTLFVIAAQKL